MTAHPTVASPGSIPSILTVPSEKAKNQTFTFNYTIVWALSQSNKIKTFDESLNQVAQTVAEYCKKQVINYHKPQQAQVVNQVSAADELKKFKELLDMGVITQEEFDAKKKELLGI